MKEQEYLDSPKDCDKTIDQLTENRGDGLVTYLESKTISATVRAETYL